MAPNDHNSWLSRGAIVLVPLIAGLAWWSTSKNSAPLSSENPAAPKAEVHSPAAAFLPSTPPVPLPARPATRENPALSWERLLATDGSPQEDISSLNDLLSTYLQATRGTERLPIAFNEDLAKTLTDRSVLGDVAIPPNHPAIRDGRLLDRWGTPWQVHPLSSEFIQLRSAGPDRRLYTPDDLVFPKSPEEQR